MREILFRGKRVDTGEWVYGYYVQIADETNGDARVQHSILIPTFMSNSGFRLVEVIHETVGQYTETKDKNDKEIFEGDILLFDYRGDKWKVEVVWSGNSWATCEPGFYPDLLDTYDMNASVIGNIHDNPELLKEQNEK